MDALPAVEGHIHAIMDKLGGVREALIQKDDDWEEWSLTDLVRNLGKFVDRNPLSTRNTNK